MKDALGDRMKRNYENRTRLFLPRRTFTVIRVDGKAFHTYTRGCQRPYDEQLMAAMDATTKALCEQIEGVRLGYVQSDEISLILTDFGGPQTEAWFDGNIQKMASISASIAGVEFNRTRMIQDPFKYGRFETVGFTPALQPIFKTGLEIDSLAYFDSRVFTIPDPTEVENYLIWRQQDATRNSISMTAQAHFSHKELQGKKQEEMQEMLFTLRGINWNDMPDGFKRGRCLVRRATARDIEYVDKRTGEKRVKEGVTRHEWQVEAPPIFTQDRGWLAEILPKPS